MSFDLGVAGLLFEEVGVFFIFLQRFGGGFVEIEGDFFGVVIVLVGFSLGSAMTELFLLSAS